MCGRVLFLLICASIVYTGTASTLIRGASPDNIAKYTPKDGKFTCFDGTLTIDFSQVNDNFCDCPDSSDEPGTSACPNGVFYCRNRGHEPRLLATSFVDDGICDCCDGTDELSGCKNTCIEKNSAKRDAIKKEIDDYKSALDRKAQYASSANGVRENIKQRFQNVDSDIENAEKELERLTVERKKAEEEAEVKREEHKQEQAKLAAQRKADAEAARKKAEEEAAEKAAADKAAADAAAQQAADAQQQGEATDKEETDEERGRRIASQWTNDPAAAASADSAQKDDSADKKDVNGGSWSLSSAWSKARDSVNKLVNKGDEAAPAPEEEAEEDAVLPPSPYELEEEGWTGSDDPDYLPFDDSVVRQAQRDHEAAEKKLSELKAEKERVNRQVNYSFNDAWAGLLNKCLESREPQFTYKFCFFDKATQIDNGGGHETNLGFWKGFEQGGTVAVFEGGDYCHKAPPRSLRVHLQCGGDERAWDASEPSTCSYAVHASTPAACKADKLKELQDNLDALLAEEAALAKEIAEEEKQRQAQLAGMRDRIGGGAGRSPHDEL